MVERSLPYHNKLPRPVVLNHVSGPQKAFTLAEVLITLAIIGVVAALTIPTVVRNYQKQQYVTQLKKAVTTLNQAFTLAMANDGVTKLEDSEFVQSINFGDQNTLYKARTTDQSAFTNVVRKYFKVSKAGFLNISGSRKNLAGTYTSNRTSSFYVIVVADGATYEIQLYNTSECKDYVKSAGGKLECLIGEVYVDLNGFDKAPNVWGRDVYRILISNNGFIYPYGGREAAIWYAGADWKSSDKYWKNDVTLANCSTYSSHNSNNGCAARIMEEGWQMNY